MSDSADLVSVVDAMLPERSDDEALASLVQAYTRHTNEACDFAPLTPRPLTQDELIAMDNVYEHVAAYITVTLDELIKNPEGVVRSVMISKLSDSLPITGLTYEVVWGSKQLLLLYVKGTISTVNP